MSETRAIFVYGTLRPGGKFWANISEFIEHYDPGLLTGYELWDLDDGYPAIVPGSGMVFGDILYVRTGKETEVLLAADDIERFKPDDPGSLYLRQQVTVARLRDPNGVPVPAHVYIFNSAHRPYLIKHGRELPNGVWRGPDQSAES